MGPLRRLVLGLRSGAAVRPVDGPVRADERTGLQIPDEAVVGDEWVRRPLWSTLDWLCHDALHDGWMNSRVGRGIIYGPHPERVSDDCVPGRVAGRQAVTWRPCKADAHTTKTSDAITVSDQNG